MRYAFKTANQHTTWADLLATWREADQIDVFESGWVFDHLYPIQTPDGAAQITGPCLEGWSLLAALAQATDRVRLGCLVTGAHFRHPALLAKMAATVDIVSNGRLEIGLGGGWNSTETDAYGIELLPLRQRFDRFDEYCHVLTSLLENETTDFHGRYFSVSHGLLSPKAVQRPRPPILIGGNGERRTLRTVARFADHWNFVRGEPDVFARKLDVLREHCDEIGRDIESIQVSAQVWLDSKGDLGRLRAEVVSLAELGLDLAIIYLPPPHSPAELLRVAEGLR